MMALELYKKTLAGNKASLSTNFRFAFTIFENHERSISYIEHFYVKFG